MNKTLEFQKQSGFAVVVNWEEKKKQLMGMIEFYLIVYGQKSYSWFNNWIILTAEVALRMTSIVLNGHNLIPIFWFGPTSKCYTVSRSIYKWIAKRARESRYKLDITKNL